MHSLWEVRLTFGKGLALLLFPGWYPPFVQRSGPLFVGPVLDAHSWGTRWKSSSGRIHAWHGLDRKAGPSGRVVEMANFA